jgi:outer membrane protein, heavy metal efflux system
LRHDKNLATPLVDLRAAFSMRHAWTRAGLVGCLAALGACAAAPPPQDFDVQRSAQALSERSLAAPAVIGAFARNGIEYPGIDGHWSLDALTLAAWQLRPELAESQALLAAAGADVTAAGRRANPSWSLTPEWVANAATGTSPWVAALLLTQFFEPSAQRQARVDQAQSKAGLALQQQAQTAWEIRQQLATSAIELSLDQLTATQAGAEVKLQQQLRATAELAQTAGALPRRDLLSAQLQAEQAQVRREESLQRVREAQAQLAAAIGIDAAALSQLTLELPDPELLARQPELDDVALRQAAAINRIDIAVALAEYAAADAAWREQWSRQRPGLTLSPGYTYDTGQRKWVLGIGGELPINDDYGPALAAAAARREATAHHVEALQAAALAALALAEQQLGEGRRALRQADRLLQTERKLAESQQLRAQAGAIQRSELLAAQLQLLQAEQGRISVLRELALALGALETAVQKPLWPPSALARAPQSELGATTEPRP